METSEFEVIVGYVCENVLLAFGKRNLELECSVNYDSKIRRKVHEQLVCRIQTSSVELTVQASS